MIRARLDKKKTEMASMFDGVARRYDVTNDAMTFGLARLWRREITRAVDPRPGERILDLAAGTGVSSVPLQAAGAQVVAGDISEGMLAVGRQKRPEITFVHADATDLPFADAEFDAVTITYGLRNVQDPERALGEMLRVLKPGGRLVVAEFSTLESSALNTVYSEYIMAALPAVARAVSSNPEAYVYLAESIREWPDQETLAHLIRDVGFDQVKYRNLTGGIVAVHHALKPLDSGDDGDGADSVDDRAATPVTAVAAQPSEAVPAEADSSAAPVAGIRSENDEARSEDGLAAERDPDREDPAGTEADAGTDADPSIRLAVEAADSREVPASGVEAPRSAAVGSAAADRADRIDADEDSDDADSADDRTAAPVAAGDSEPSAAAPAEDDSSAAPVAEARADDDEVRPEDGIAAAEGDSDRENPAGTEADAATDADPSIRLAVEAADSRTEPGA